MRFGWEYYGLAYWSRARRGRARFKENVMDAKVYELLNDQIRKELYSAYLYLSFADYYQEEGLEGFAHWYEIQTQ